MSQIPVDEMVREALDRLPEEDGGIAIVLATSGTPPALALLSTGDVVYTRSRVSLGIHASSSAVDRLGTSFTLLVPLGETAARIECQDATVKRVPPLAKITGRIGSIRLTAEPPWCLEMNFRPLPADDPSIPDYLDYWRSVRAWLSGEKENPPPMIS